MASCNLLNLFLEVWNLVQMDFFELENRSSLKKFKQSVYLTEGV